MPKSLLIFNLAEVSSGVKNLITFYRDFNKYTMNKEEVTMEVKIDLNKRRVINTIRRREVITGIRTMFRW